MSSPPTVSPATEEQKVRAELRIQFLKCLSALEGQVKPFWLIFLPNIALGVYVFQPAPGHSAYDTQHMTLSMTTLSITTFSIMTLSMKGLYVTLSISGT
jgi:hypothetical protein